MFILNKLARTSRCSMLLCDSLFPSICSINTQHLDNDLGFAVLKLQHMKYPYLSIRQSTLGPTVGAGLFATQDIDVKDRGGILCFFFGNLALCTEDQVRQGDEEPLFTGCSKNLILFPTMYNPVIYSKDDSCTSNDQLQLYLVGSDCCMASYANTAGPDECNAFIKDIPPKGWDFHNGFCSLDNFLGIVRNPVLCLALTRYMHGSPFHNMSMYFFLRVLYLFKSAEQVCEARGGDICLV
jgi:hypothetical protein